LRRYRFAEAYETLYHTIWDDVADWWLEATKARGQGGVEASPAAVKHVADDPDIEVLQYLLKLAHPFAPFVTETIWQSLYNDDKSTTLLISQPWPKKLTYNRQLAASFDQLQAAAVESRRLTQALGGQPRRLFYGAAEELAAQASELKLLARLESVEPGAPSQGLRLPLADAELWLEATPQELADYQAHLDHQLAELQSQIKHLETRLGNQAYVNQAPADLVAASRADLAAKQQLAARLTAERG
jgi:valyl-tRNA synthetase